MDLPASVTELQRGDTTFYIIGTAHVSKQSIDDVKNTIDQVQPEVVCVELDFKRHASLTRQDAFRYLDVVGVIRDGKALYLVVQLALAAYQNKIGSRLGVRPGAEMLAAIEAAVARNCRVELIDRDIAVTLMRTWRNLGTVPRALLSLSLAVAFIRGEGDKPIDVEQLKEPKNLSVMLDEIGRAMPQIKAPLIDERDQYMISKLLEVGAGKRKVVAVVGAAHVPGMIAYADEPIDRAPLEQVPPASRTWRAILKSIPIAFVIALGWTWFRGDASARTLYDMMLTWMLPTSIGASLGVLFARGNIQAIATAFAVSPVAAILPSMSTGTIAGLVQAKQVPAQATDRETLVLDIQSFKGFRRNPLTRALLVAIFASLGTTIGFAIGVIRVIWSF